MNWTLARAKDQLSEVIRQAQEFGPQRITVRGERKAVVISEEDYEALCAPDAPKTLKELLLRMNLEGLDLERDQTPARDLDL
ncbi:MAG TPA: type II toxin-antitoxin system Phd/YefM family antitoxin [Caulobacteraceae bacterium]|nr:type II toxin-antitoxin system Phd/YefM family antitoxin [Caulobacteraceae bacterium]